MTVDMILALATLCAVLFCCIREIIPAHLAAMVGFAFLVACGIIDQTQMLSVFSNAAPFTIACMFVMAAAIEQSGVMHRLLKIIERLAKRSPGAAMGSLYGMVGFMSGFVNNTPVVLLIAPMLSRLGQQMRIPASKLLIPLSYIAILGGACTLIGTSTNLLVDSVAQQSGLESFGMFELTPAGLSIMGACVAFMVFIGWFLLPVRRPLREDIDEARATSRLYMTDIQITDKSPFIGQTLKEMELAKKVDAEIVDLIRAREPEPAADTAKDTDEQPAEEPSVRKIIAQLIRRTRRRADNSPTPSARPVADDTVQDPDDGQNTVSAIHDMKLRAGDVLVFRATRPQIEELRGFFKASLEEDAPYATHAEAVPELIMTDILITGTSRYIGTRISEMWILSYYGLEPVALHRKGQNITGDLGAADLRAGDVLIVEGTEEAVTKFLKNEQFVRADSDRSGMLGWRAWGSLAALAAVVLVAALGIMPIAAAALIGAMGLLLGRFLKLKVAYRSIQWPIMMLIYGMLGISLALESTGAAQLIVDSVISVIGAASPLVILSCFYLLTSVLTEVMSNNAAAVILTPLAIGIAQSLGVDPRPFVVAVMLGASASFATPLGYQTNTYVYGLGNYKFTDFLKIGVPMNIIAWAVATFVIPMIWPL